MGVFSRSWKVLSEEGIGEFIKRVSQRNPVELVYNIHVAPYLPKQRANYNGVETNSARMFDQFVPWRSRDVSNYESGLFNAIEAQVEAGDTVVIVGGGVGATAVEAAEEVGETGTVIVYEGGADEVETVRETARINGVKDRVTAHHAIVGPEIQIRGPVDSARSIHPSEIPECDVLELDCEGSEVGILGNIEVLPRAILVESHGMYDAPPARLRELLCERGYTVVSEEIAIAGEETFCEGNGIYVLTGVREEVS